MNDSHQQPICRPQSIDSPQWVTRCEPTAERDGWSFAGSGVGFRKLVWDNASFEGVPTDAGLDAPYRYELDKVGCPVPGSVRWVGTYDPGPYLGRGMRFQMAVRAGGGIARLYVNGELVAGHQSDKWASKHGLEGQDARIRPIAGSVAFAGADMEYVEMFTPPLDLTGEFPAAIVIEYAIENGFNFLGAKNFKEHVGRECGAETDYSWMEIISEDLCYPDEQNVGSRSGVD